MRMSKTSPLLATLTATAVIAGCGSSSSGVSAGAYVKSICNAVAPFERDVVARSSALNLTTVKGPAQGKQALQDFLTAISSDTDAAVSKLKAAGSPNVNNGKQIASAIVSAFSQLSSAMHQAATQSNSLPTSNATAFRSGATTLGNEVRTSMGNIGSNLQSSTLKSPDLQKAAGSEPACKSLGAA